MAQTEESKYNDYVKQLEKSKNELQIAKNETRQAEEMMEEMIADQKNERANSSEDLLGVIKQLQSQFELQKQMLAKYEPKLKKKDKENKELTLNMRQLRADAANAQLETDKLKKELSNVKKQQEEASSKYEDVSNEEWMVKSNQLQQLLDDRSEQAFTMESQTAELKFRLSELEKKLESRDMDIAITDEVIKELRKKLLVVEENEGWEVEGDGWNEDSDEVNVETMKEENENLLAVKKQLEDDIENTKKKLADDDQELFKYKEEASATREARDKVVRDYNEAQKKLEVLTEFFNKKEAELQKQIGLQSAKFGDLNLDAESTTKKLEIINEELKITREDLQSKKKELENQEKELKASVGDQEKKAHECWVAARQAERKVTELQVD